MNPGNENTDNRVKAENKLTAQVALGTGEFVADGLRGFNEFSKPKSKPFLGNTRKTLDTLLSAPVVGAKMARDTTGYVVGEGGNRLLKHVDKFLTERAPDVRRTGEAGLQRIGEAAVQGTDYASRGLQGTLAGAEYAAAQVAEARERLAASSSKLVQKVWEKRPKTLSDYLLKSANALADIPTFYKLAFLICFYFFFYKIFYDIGIFFGLSSVELILYMAWFGMLLFFVSFIKPNRSRLY
jgi:hypothetical protein